MATTDIRVGELCNECACLVAYGDDSGLDPEQLDVAEATIGAIRRDEGGRLIVEPAAEDASHCLRCALCGDDVVAGGHLLTVHIEP